MSIANLTDLKILYRGPLASCNYDCVYCPFAKQTDSREELDVDRAKLKQFCDWVELHPDGISLPGISKFSILFTPWGEGLTRRWYREALVRLSHFDQVKKVAIQTNLACGLEWIKTCDLASLGLWCTWHPTQISMDKFLERCYSLDQIGARYSVGLVGTHEHRQYATEMRKRLSPDVYFWINAYKRELGYYSDSDIEFWNSIDPLFDVNNTRHPSEGKQCRAGETSVSIDGDGNIRRCHFIKEVIGNIYEAGFETDLRSRVCTNATCGCHIGYVHLNKLNLYETFGDGIMERIPAKRVWQLDAH